MEVFGTQLGLTYASQTLRDQITALGWEVGKVKLDTKRDRYEATAKREHGDEVKQYGRTERLALSNLLLAITRRSGRARLGRWETTFADQLAEIAEAYAKAPLYDPKASAAFMELARDCDRRVQVLSEHLQLQLVNDPDPYKKPEQMVDDVKKRRRLKVSRAGADHPLWSQDQVIAYRICHDVLGYVAADAGWDWYGENEAFAAHAAILGAEAQKALFVESVGAAAYALYYRAYGPQKVALLPQFMDATQEQQNPHRNYPGVHPSQSFPAAPLPEAKPKIKASVEAGEGAPQEGAQSLWLDRLDEPHLAAGTGLLDPNANWESGEAPIMTSNGLTVAQAYGDPLEADKVADNAAQIIPRYNGAEWAQLNQQNPAEAEQMKRAIVNAFRVVLLSPRKDLQWNSVHYQDLKDVPPEEDRPEVYWHALEKSRQEWNMARGYERFSHVPYVQQLPTLISILYQRDPHAGFEAAQQRARQLLFDWGTEEQEKVMAEDEDKPEEKRRAGFQIEAKVNAQMAKRLKQYIAESKPDMDHAWTRAIQKHIKLNPLETEQYMPVMAAAEGQAVLPGMEPSHVGDPTTIDRSKYGAFMGAHLKAIAQVSRHVDDILQAALEDVHEHDGGGHHFRAAVLQLGIPGVGPKVASFAWLLLQPMTSQLATIDTHILDTLGMNERQYNNRDYFGFERSLQARRDAAGYSHVPLGQFQWGMWDYKRTGPGSHQDHSAMRVLDPVSHEDIDWASKQQPINAAQAVEHKQMWQRGQAPEAEWWNHTADAGDAAWEDWRETMAPGVGKNQVPYANLPLDYDPSVYTARLAGSGLIVPWFTHPDSGERFTGSPGETNMAHLMRVTGLSVPEIWSQFEEAGKTSGDQTPAAASAFA